MIAQGNAAATSAANPSESERQSLLMIRELINSKLGMSGDQDSGVENAGKDVEQDGVDVNVNTPPSSIVLKAEESDVRIAEAGGEGDADEDMIL